MRNSIWDAPGGQEEPLLRECRRLDWRQPPGASQSKQQGFFLPVVDEPFQHLLLPESFFEPSPLRVSLFPRPVRPWPWVGLPGSGGFDGDCRRNERLSPRSADAGPGPKIKTMHTADSKLVHSTSSLFYKQPVFWPASSCLSFSLFQPKNCLNFSLTEPGVA